MRASLALRGVEMTRLVTQIQLRNALERQGALLGVPSGGVPGPADILAAIAMVEGASFTYPGYANLDTIGDLDRVGELVPDGKGTWGPSVSAWQIRTIQGQTGTGQVRDIEFVTDNIDNAANSAVKIWRSQGYTAWTVYRENKHIAYLPEFYPPKPGKYVVKSGDTFTKIDAILFLSMGTMQKMNPTIDPYQLQIGQELNIPFIERTVQGGDTISRLMRLAGWVDPLPTAQVNRVIKFAGLQNSTIHSGQVLRILKPGTEWLAV